MKKQPTFWTTLCLLLGAARKRSTGRQARQHELLSNRSGNNAADWGAVGFFFAAIFMVGLNVAAAFVLRTAIATAQRVEVERQGGMVVSRLFFEEAETAEPGETPAGRRRKDAFYRAICAQEAARIAIRTGGDRSEIQAQLLDSVRQYGTSHLVTQAQLPPQPAGQRSNGRFPAMIGSIVLLWWLAMLVFQGEGLELDLQRRRHPMWEWLFSHPAPPGAIFLAEMLAPIAANPIYWGAPLFVVTIYSFTYNFALGLLAGVLVGVPITVAAACLGKACEIAVTLRFSPRSRGAMIGFMSWIGYASLMLFLLGIFLLPRFIEATARVLYPVSILPFPWLRLFLGGQSDGSWSFPAGVLACWILAAIVIALAIRFSVWGAQLGLSGVSAGSQLGPTSRRTAAHFGKEPLYRKELLWFVRDRSAIVQTILIPLTVASVQVFNLRGVLIHAAGAWNYLCGAGILFGTYFLWILGPKSLSSEGTALWIALTWPRGLESLLRAKAWLWSLISTGIVTLVLACAALMFHADAWKIALVLIGWFFFSRSMAEKSVTLVTITSESGEVQKVPWGRRLAAQLGMATFAIGILSQQWHIAVMGIVYSYVTAAAMWQNFRARLPYLYDPWSEQIPPPPTLMHAMISISVLVECGAVLSGILLVIAGPANIAIAQAIAYAVCSVAVSFGVISFLANRNVSLQDVIRWQSPANRISVPQLLPALTLAAVGGIALGLFAHGYLAALQHIPATAGVFRKSREAMARLHGLRISYAIMAVAFAPFAEEYLFRGLLFGALDREWGGWRAVIGNAAFFAVYHPVTSWPPVFLLGVCNALIFKKSGRLAPAILLHMVYNAVVLI
jgi:membrane protease YdiL (CAAX protease family)